MDPRWRLPVPLATLRRSIVVPFGESRNFTLWGWHAPCSKHLVPCILASFRASSFPNILTERCCVLMYVIKGNKSEPRSRKVRRLSFFLFFSCVVLFLFFLFFKTRCAISLDFWAASEFVGGKLKSNGPTQKLRRLREDYPIRASFVECPVLQERERLLDGS